MTKARAEDRYRTRKTERRIVFISGDNTRTYSIRPWLLFGCIGAVMTVSAGLLGATGYLIFRDDLFDLVHARNAVMQQAYEDRIARLRSEIDKISSRQILDQVALDDKLERLLAAQQGIADRQKAVSALIDKAAAIGLVGADGKQAAADGLPAPAEGYAANTSGPAGAADAAFAPLLTGSIAPARPATVPLDADGRPDLKTMARQLAAVDAEQARAVETIADAATARARAAAQVVGSLGVAAALPPLTGASGATGNDGDDDAVGGPYIPLLGGSDALGAALDDAGKAFDRLTAIKAAVVRLPVERPLPGADMTSNFGSRRDPFLGSMAFHAGIDFRSSTGTDVRPTAPGVVTNASWAGGYGNMVEVDHGHGLVTRYGHLSRIIAGVGQKVDRDTVIGEVGSTGRSTGPHLHYETRIDGTAINPVTFIDAGIKLSALLP